MMFLPRFMYFADRARSGWKRDIVITAKLGKINLGQGLGQIASKKETTPSIAESSLVYCQRTKKARRMGVIVSLPRSPQKNPAE